MQRIKIKQTRLKTPRMKLEYYLVLKGGMCGIEIRDTHSNESAVRFIPDTAEKVYRFLVRLARHTVTPCTLDDVVDDYIYGRWQSKRGLYLLVTDSYTGLDSGERDTEAIGDLLPGVATDEG